MTSPDIDIVGVILDFLDTSWNTENCPKPIIKRVEEVKRINVKSSAGYILLYESSGLHISRGDVQWDSRDWAGSVSADIRTVNGVNHVNQIYAELDRLLLTLRRDVTGTGWHKLEGTDRTNLTNKAVGLWRYVVEIKLVARKKLIGD